jgi:hypothetical protein
MKKGIVVSAIIIVLLSGCVTVNDNVPPVDLPPQVDSTQEKINPTSGLRNTEGLTLQSGGLSFSILSPMDGEVIGVSPVQVTVISTSEAAFTINGDLFILPSGKESTFLVSLVEGFNPIEIIASDYEGNQVETVLTVIYEP